MLELGNKIDVAETFIPPWTGDVPGMKTIYGDMEDQYRIQFTNHVEYVQRHRPLHLDLFTMRAPIPGKRYPAVLYIPGSGWMEQDLYGRLPQLVEVARCGYVVASMEYRHTDEGCRFPAQVEDAKSALRYLRAHADDLDLDPERIAIWGDSSGAHTALLAGLSGEEEFLTDDSPGYPTSVRCIVDLFGPTDFDDAARQPSGIDHAGADSIEGKLLGAPPAQVPELVRRADPISYLSDQRWAPPTLILHGDRDDMVPFHQSVLLYEAYRRCGQQADFYLVRNAAHGFRIWTEPVMKVIKDFLRAHL